MMRKVLYFAAAICLLGCKSDLQKVQELSDAEHVPSLRIIDGKGRLMELGHAKATFAAPTILQYNFAAQKHTEFPDGIEIFRYNDSLALEASIAANSATYHEYKNLWEATGSVQVRNTKGEVLETEKLYWDTKTHRIYSDVWVKITTADAIINGEGLTSDETFNNWEVLKISNSFIFVDETKEQP